MVIDPCDALVEDVLAHVIHSRLNSLLVNVSAANGTRIGQKKAVNETEPVRVTNQVEKLLFLRCLGEFL